MIAQGAYAAAPSAEAAADIDVYPLLGPMGGGTEVQLQVSCSPCMLFADPMHLV